MGFLHIISTPLSKLRTSWFGATLTSVGFFFLTTDAVAHTTCTGVNVPPNIGCRRAGQIITVINGSTPTTTPVSPPPTQTSPAPSGTSGATTTAPTGGQTTPTPAQQCPPGNTTCYSMGRNASVSFDITGGTNGATGNTGARIGGDYTDPSSNVNGGIQLDTRNDGGRRVQLDASGHHITRNPVPGRNPPSFTIQGGVTGQPSGSRVDANAFLGFNFAEYFAVASREAANPGDPRGAQNPLQREGDERTGRDFARLIASIGFTGRVATAELNEEERTRARIGVALCVHFAGMMGSGGGGIATLQARVFSCFEGAFTSAWGDRNDNRVEILARFMAEVRLRFNHSYLRSISFLARGGVEYSNFNDYLGPRPPIDGQIYLGLSWDLDSQPQIGNRTPGAGGNRPAPVQDVREPSGGQDQGAHY